MSNKDIAISVKNVSKDFKLPHEQHSGLKQVVLGLFKMGRQPGYEIQHVLKDVSFDIEKGDFFGIVGRNGSGKSTLLKIISEIYAPEKGSVEVNGSLTPFIELGVGFNPELTGRENVYMNGALLGFSNKQMDAMYDEIVEFAELERFMDQKLKNYSSGMQVRLAFSIAIRADSDILVLDEVLAVGDEAFQRKCDDYFSEIKKRGKTIVLVTHSMESVKKYCNKALMIKDGKVVASGSPEDVSDMYEVENLKVSAVAKKDGKTKPVEAEDSAVCNLKIKVVSPKNINQDELISLEFTYDVNEDIDTYIDMTMMDMKTRALVLNDSQMDNPAKGSGSKRVAYSCDIAGIINDVNIRIYASVFNAKTGKKIVYTQEGESPLVLLRRNDVKSKRDKRSKMALLHTKGEWT